MIVNKAPETSIADIASALTSATYATCVIGLNIERLAQLKALGSSEIKIQRTQSEVLDEVIAQYSEVYPTKDTGGRVRLDHKRAFLEWIGDATVCATSSWDKIQARLAALQGTNDKDAGSKVVAAANRILVALEKRANRLYEIRNYGGEMIAVALMEGEKKLKAEGGEGGPVKSIKSTASPEALEEFVIGAVQHNPDNVVALLVGLLSQGQDVESIQDALSTAQGLLVERQAAEATKAAQAAAKREADIAKEEARIAAAAERIAKLRQAQ
jgi:hypothetical protein